MDKNKQMQKIQKSCQRQWGDGSREQQTSTTLKLFWLGETEGVRTLTNIAGIKTLLLMIFAEMSDKNKMLLLQ